jgi:hypothetical protein
MKALIILIFLLSSSFTFSKNPDWIENSKKACRGNELCAVGSSESRKGAEVQARVALSKIFDTRINSKFTSSLKSQGKETNEDLSEEISEATEMALAGVEIQKHHEDKTTFYALAVLNKTKAADGIKKEITAIDEQMKVLLGSGEDLQKAKLEKLFVKRDVLNRQHSFLTNFSVPEVVSYEEVFKAKNRATKNILVHVYLDEDEPKQVESLVQSLMTKMGMKISSGRVRNPKSTHVVTGELVADKQYLNVEGFEKYKFILKLKAMQSAGSKETGHLNFEVIESGRNFSHAHEQAMPKIQEFIKTNIDKLNIE